MSFMKYKHICVVDLRNPDEVDTQPMHHFVTLDMQQMFLVSMFYDRTCHWSILYICHHPRKHSGSNDLETPDEAIEKCIIPFGCVSP